MRDMEPLITTLMVGMWLVVLAMWYPEVRQMLACPQMWGVSLLFAVGIASDMAPAKGAGAKTGFCAQSAATGGDMASKAVSKMPMM